MTSAHDRVLMLQCSYRNRVPLNADLPGAELHPRLQLPDPVDDAYVPIGHGEQYWDPATLD